MINAIFDTFKNFSVVNILSRSYQVNDGQNDFIDKWKVRSYIHVGLEYDTRNCFMEHLNHFCIKWR